MGAVHPPARNYFIREAFLGWIGRVTCIDPFLSVLSFVTAAAAAFCFARRGSRWHAGVAAVSEGVGGMGLA